MSNYYLVSPFVSPGPASATHTSPQVAIGLEVDAIDKNAASADGGAAGRFVYARGSNVASVGAFCHLVNGSAVMLASANSASAYPIGVAAGLLSATNVYGWVMVQGRCDFARGTNTVPASAVPYYFAATAGHVASNAGAGSRIQGIAGVPGQTNTAISSAGSYKFDLNRPFCAGLTAAL